MQQTPPSKVGAVLGLSDVLRGRGDVKQQKGSLVVGDWTGLGVAGRHLNCRGVANAFCGLERGIRQSSDPSIPGGKGTDLIMVGSTAEYA